MSSQPGASGNATGPAGPGGEAGSTAGGLAGTSASEGGATEGGASPNAGGGDDSAAGEGGEPASPVFTLSKLIDNMEDGNATLLETNGDWFVFHDATGGTITPLKGQTFAMSPLNPARGESKKAAAVTVSGFTGWGAAFGFDFAYSNGVRQPTDLKEALGVRFWAKASRAATLRFQIPNADTDSLGGKCSGTEDNACNAHWTRNFNVGTEWKETTIPFARLKQDLAGRHVPSFDKQHVYSSFFVIGPDEALTVWVDDIALVH